MDAEAEGDFHDGASLRLGPDDEAAFMQVALTDKGEAESLPNVCRSAYDAIGGCLQFFAAQ